MSGNCPFITMNCHLTAGFPLDFPFMSFSRFPSSWSCPFHAFQLPLHVPEYVRFIFHVCPVLSLRVISLHLPSCRIVSLLFPLHSPCCHFCALHVLSVPLCFPFISRCFPVMSTSYVLPSCPCTSLHFPFAPQYFPQKNTVFQRFCNQGVQKHRVFQDFRQKEAGTPNQQRSDRGNRAWDPCFATPARRLRLVERHQIAARSVGGGGWGGHVSDVGRGGGLSSILS